jgi:hypothetical protein
VFLIKFQVLNLFNNTIFYRGILDVGVLYNTKNICYPYNMIRNDILGRYNQYMICIYLFGGFFLLKFTHKAFMIKTVII